MTIENNDILNDYVCLNPFKHLEFFEKDVYCCCPGWLNMPVGDINNLNDIWQGERLKNIQNSVLDGSYSYCDKNLCPALSGLYYNNKNNDFSKKSDFIRNNYNKGPEVLNFSFDNSCNLSCPSCRTNLIMADSNELVNNNNIMENISKNFGGTVTTMMMIGSGDVFASKTFRNFLIDFDIEKYPKIESLSIQTNGMLLNKEMWNKMIKSRDLIKMINISVDAATKETYEKIRRGGKWEILMENLKFITKLNCVITFTFIVQDTNYKEMESFYNLIMSIIPSSKISFTKITNWGTYSEEEFKNKEIYNEYHPEFNLFLNELNKIAFKYNISTNMGDIIEKYLKNK